MRCALQDPDALLTWSLERIPKNIWLAFASAIVSGLFAHLYMFTNKLPNHDDLSLLLANDDTMASTGRWLASVVLRLDGNWSTPWLIGVLTLLSIAVAVCMTVSVLRIRHPAGCILTAALMTAFPTVTSTFTYMFLADTYFFAVALASIAAWVTVKWRFGFVFGIVLLAMSMGIYQSYFAVTAVLLVGALLLETLDRTKNFRDLLICGLKFVGTLAAGMTLYLTITWYVSRQIPLADYAGISAMGQISLTDIPIRLWNCLKAYYDFFVWDVYNVHFDFLGYAPLWISVSTVILILIISLKESLKPWQAALALCMVIVYLIAGGIIYLMTPGAVHAVMIYGLVFSLLLPLALREVALDLPLDGWTNILRNGLSWLIIGSLALTAYSYQIVSNKAYLKMDLSLKQCLSYSNRMLSRVESCDGYVPGMDLVLVESGQQVSALNPTPELNEIVLTGVYDLDAYRYTYSYCKFFQYFTGYSGIVRRADDGEKNMDAVQLMPYYPQAGSVKVIDGQVIVRVS